MKNNFKISFCNSNLSAFLLSVSVLILMGFFSTMAAQSIMQNQKGIILDEDAVKPTQKDPGLPPKPSLKCLEICNNGIDDDNDGWIDALDPDCNNMTPFSCDGKLYQTFNPSGFWFVEVTSNPVNFAQIATGLNTINSIAFNPIDNFIYGINPDYPHQLYRVDANGILQNLGNVTGLPDNSFAGAMNNQGVLYISGSHQKLYTVNIFTGSKALIGDIGRSCADFAFSPDDGQLYGWDYDNQILVRIDPSDATAATVGQANPDYKVVGAFYFNAQGEIIAYGNYLGNATQQETLVKINPSTGVVTPLGTGPDVNENDGCSCSFGLEMTKCASNDSVLLGDTFSYTFTFFNRSGGPLSNITFTDNLGNGLTWASEPHSLSNISLGLTAINGNANAAFTITTMGLGVSSFIIDVQAPESCTCPVQDSNQAALYNVPTYLGSTVYSDDPVTCEITDPTVITLVCEIPDSIEETDQNLKKEFVIEAFPNPFSKEIFINFTPNSTEQVTISIFDAEGKWIEDIYSGEVYADKTINVCFQPANVSSNIYFAKLITQSGSIIAKKLIFMR